MEEHQNAEQTTVTVEPGEQVVVFNPEKLALLTRRNQGASWFKTIGFFAVVNFLLVFFGIKIRFIFALGITYMANLVAHQFHSGAIEAVSILFTLLGAAGAYFFARMASKGQSWAFVAGMALYSLDLLLWVYIQDPIEIAAHCFALYQLYLGLAANREYRAKFPA